MSADDQGQLFSPPGRGGKAKANPTPGNRSRTSSGRRNGPPGGKSPTPSTENDRSSAPTPSSATGKQEHGHNNAWSRPLPDLGSSMPGRVTESPIKFDASQNQHVTTRSKKVDNPGDLRIIPSDDINRSKNGSDDTSAAVTIKSNLSKSKRKMLQDAAKNLENLKINLEGYRADIESGSGGPDALRISILDDRTVIENAEQVGIITNSRTIGIIASKLRAEYDQIQSDLETKVFENDESSIESQEEIKSYQDEAGNSDFIIDTKNVGENEPDESFVGSLAHDRPDQLKINSTEGDFTFRNHTIDPIIGHSESIFPFEIRVGRRVTVTVERGTTKTCRFGFITDFASYSSEQKMIGNSEPIHVPTSLQYADVGTKNVGRIQRNRLHANMIGYQHYPPMDSEHFKLLQLDQCHKTFRQDD